MKKLFISMLAVAAVVACSKEETIIEQAPEAIAFDTFVENATRADITKDNLIEFSVYASIENTSGANLILTDEKVYKNNNAWTYGNVQYWVPQAMYNFAAFAPYANRHWTYTPTTANGRTTANNGTLAFNNQTAAANEDLIFASTMRDLTNTAKLESQPDSVAFIFGHQLSKIAFKFNNAFQTANNITLRVYNVNVAGLVAEATAPVTAGTADAWIKKGDTTFARTFGAQVAANAENTATIIAAQGNVVTDSHYFIPVANTEYTITFSVDLIQAGVLVDTYNHTIKVTPALAKGGNYLFTTTLDYSNVSDDPTKQLYPIEFTVTDVTGWDPADNDRTDTTIMEPTTGNN